jgi:hypothetical protein
MAIIYSKTVDNKLAATEAKTEVNTYSYELLLEQKRRIEGIITENQGYLVNIEKLIVEADKLGVKSIEIKG